jgi:hypothetical protein
MRTARHGKNACNVLKRRSKSPGNATSCRVLCLRTFAVNSRGQYLYNCLSSAHEIVGDCCVESGVDRLLKPQVRSARTHRKRRSKFRSSRDPHRSGLCSAPRRPQDFYQLRFDNHRQPGPDRQMRFQTTQNLRMHSTTCQHRESDRATQRFEV